MSKKKDALAIAAKRYVELNRLLGDGSLKSKKREKVSVESALLVEQLGDKMIDKLHAKFNLWSAPEATPAVEPSSKKKGKKAAESDVEKLKDKAADPGVGSNLSDKVAESAARHLANIRLFAELAAIAEDPDAKKKVRKVVNGQLDDLAKQLDALTASRWVAELVAPEVDRKNEHEVSAYARGVGRASGYAITGDAEKTKQQKRAAGDKAVAAAVPELDAAGLAKLSDAEMKARVEAKRAARTAAEEGADRAAAEWNAAKATDHVTEAVETETGTVYAVGTEREHPTAEVVMGIEVEPLPTTPDPEAEEFATVGADSNGEALDPESGLPGTPSRPKIWVPDAEHKDGGRYAQYSRTTTYIDCLEDKSNLTDWQLRLELEGLSSLDDEQRAAVFESIADAASARIEALAKLAKDDKKGRLAPGEYADLAEAAEKAYKTRLNDTARRMQDLAGRFEKADIGTELHRLCEVYDLKGMDAVEAEPNVTPSQLADVEAYARALAAAGIAKKDVLAVEQRVVNDARKTTGTLDRGFLYKPKESARKVRVVGDIKTGRIDYGPGKIALQIGNYAESEGYDPITFERTDNKYSKKLGLLIHLPAGRATCTIYEIDLNKGTEGLKLVELVKMWRRSTTDSQSFRQENAYFTKVATSAEPASEAE